jgi:hypothetical protein
MPILVLAPITRIVPPLLRQILVLAICAYWYPALLYSTSNGPPQNASTSTDHHTRTDISSTSNGNLHVLVPTYIYIYIYLGLKPTY